jgi:acyl dehydratase
MRLMVESVPFAGGLIGASVELSWPRPVRPGDTLHVESVITEIRPSRSKPDRGLVSLHSETFNQKGEPVQNLRSQLLLFRGPEEKTANAGSRG